MKGDFGAPLVAAALVLLVGCSSDETASSSTTSSRHGSTSTSAVTSTSTSVATAADPAAVLAEYIATQGDVVVSSDPVVIDGSALAVVGRTQGARDHVITVVSLTGPTGVSAADLPVPEPSYDFAPDLPVQAGDVTGDDVVDFLVRFRAADNDPGVVVSDDAGTWRLVPISADRTTSSSGATRRSPMATCARR